MSVLWRGMQVALGMLLVVGLLFACLVFGVLLYGELTGKVWTRQAVVTASEEPEQNVPKVQVLPVAPPLQKVEKPASVLLEAPFVRQLPELRAGCEITSLTMLLQFYGIAKTKMDMVKEMKLDPTPIVRNKDGSIKFWGNPNTGFVGDVTRKKSGFGIYHTALYETLKDNIPTAVDLTGKPFEKLEEQLALGIPSVVWTTTNYKVPTDWVTWDTPIGPIKTTFKEHAVLLVGYDDQFVYVNDPLAASAKTKVDKKLFIAIWEAMGKQSLTYTGQPRANTP